MKSNVSTVGFKSNLYPVVTGYYEDALFRSKVHDPFSLEYLKKNYSNITPLQFQEYNYASLHCAYAVDDDYPWGTVRNEDGIERISCKCLNTRCKLFHKCRPDFTTDELLVLEENKAARPAIFLYEEERKTRSDFEQADVDTAAKLFDKEPQQKEDDSKVEKESSSSQMSFDPFLIGGDAVPAPQPQTKKADFHSFVASTQEEIIFAPSEQRCVVNAGPGTGKTWTLIERIIEMINSGTAAPENILVLCFSRSAVDVVKNRLLQAVQAGRIGYEWQYVDIRTFDSFSTYMLAWVQDNLPELLPQHFLLEANDYESRIRQATSIFKKKKDMLADYEHIIVDEVQDLVGKRAELVIEMLRSLPETCGFTVLGDSCQSLYDYMATDDPSVMTSEKFYEQIFDAFPQAQYLSLNVNHRQGDELAEVSVPYREAILTGDAASRTSAATSILTAINEFPGKLQRFNRKDAMRYIQQGTLGILTRTNGQALQVSAWLRNEDIPHELHRGLSSPLLGDWIAKIFCIYENETIDEATFVTRHLSLFPEQSYDLARERWMALTTVQPGEARQRYEVKDLLRGLQHNANEAALFTSNADKQYSITVSNIHRSKGKEFDTVIVLDDVISAMTNPEDDDILEHKVCYVALTRPKKRIERAVIPTQFIYIAQNASRRCSKASLGRKRYISHFEVGVETDLEARTFAESEAVQAYIRNKLTPGTRLKLIKCPEHHSSHVTYRLVVEDNENIILGYTSKKFAYELESAIQKILKITKAVKFDVFPHAFCDVYVDAITTCISTMNPSPVSAKSYGEFSIWSGFSITGFAAVDKDTY